MTPRRASAGFTLMEMMVSLLLVILILSFAAVSMDAVSEETRLRRPSSEIKSFAKKAVKAAVAEQRSYSIFFHRDYFLMRERYPEVRFEEDEFRLDVPTEFEEEEQEGTVVIFRHDLGEEVGIEVRRWNAEEWLVPEGVEWVFEPSGLCEPLSVRFTRRGGFVEVDFNPLTAGVQEERLYIP